MDDAILLQMPFEELADFCRRYQVRELALFGSMLSQEHKAKRGELSKLVAPGYLCIDGKSLVKDPNVAPNQHSCHQPPTRLP